MPNAWDLQGYHVFGFTREGSATVHREWAPSAKAVNLIGEIALFYALLTDVWASTPNDRFLRRVDAVQSRAHVCRGPSIGCSNSE